MKFDITSVGPKETVVSVSSDDMQLWAELHLNAAEASDLAEKLLAAAHYIAHGCWPAEPARPAK